MNFKRDTTFGQQHLAVLVTGAVTFAVISRGGVGKSEGFTYFIFYLFLFSIIAVRQLCHQLAWKLIES